MRTCSDFVLAASLICNRIKPGLLAAKDASDYKTVKGKTFHLDKYCFDSMPEKAFFWSVLQDEDVVKVYFTGMLTHGQTEFYVSYIDPETKTLKNYYGLCVDIVAEDCDEVLRPKA